MISNKKEGVLGFYLIKFDANNPQNYFFLTTWKHNLDIENVNISISRGEHPNGTNFKELIVSYKTIFINTFTVVTKDLSASDGSINIINKHESFQLWESNISGCLLKNKDFCSFNQDGMSILSLGTTERKSVKDFEGQPKVIHSLDSFEYLKIDKDNHLNFKC